MSSLEVVVEDGVDLRQVLGEVRLRRVRKLILRVKARDAPSAMERLREYLSDSYPFTLVVEVVR